MYCAADFIHPSTDMFFDRFLLLEAWTAGLRTAAVTYRDMWVAPAWVTIQDKPTNYHS
jgi:hypothetical protein